MGYISVILIAISLAMDALAVSVTNGITVKDFSKRHAVKMGLYFGGFQFLMPLTGFFLGKSFENVIKTYDHWVAFSLLFVIGRNYTVCGGGKPVRVCRTCAVQSRRLFCQDLRHIKIRT